MVQWMARFRPQCSRLSLKLRSRLIRCLKPSKLERTLLQNQRSYRHRFVRVCGHFRQTRTTMSQSPIQIREYVGGDEDGLLALLHAQVRSDDSWPPRYAREGDDGLNWVANRSSLGRWVAVRGEQIVGHISADPVNTKNKEDAWTAELECRGDRLVEIGRLVVHPDIRRSGVSAPLTKRCVRTVVDRGFVPVASAFHDAVASQAMMTNFGWTVFAQAIGGKSGRPIVLLRPPQQLVDAALKKETAR